MADFFNPSFDANAVATFVYALSSQSTVASVASVTVTVAPIGRSGTRTRSGFVPTTVQTTLASSDVTETFGVDRKPGRAGS